jgi:hypothetical protein
MKQSASYITATREPPPLRIQPTAEDEDDGRRIAYATSLWESQTWALQSRDRQIEENVRMLAGQQWHVYSSLLQKWVDISRFLTDDERRWRQRPVVNRLLYWYMLTQARMTENPPVVTFQPATGDRSDAQLAEVMDTIFKSLWVELDMIETIDRFFSWVAAAGVGYLKTRIDITKGPFREMIGPGVMDYQGQPRLIESAPYGPEGDILGQLTSDGLGFEASGDPFRYREGKLCVDVLSPLEVRGEWGPKPWHKKGWHQHRVLLSPEDIYDTWGIECEPDTDSTDSGEMERLLYGAGYYGAVENKGGSFGWGTQDVTGLVSVRELWIAPTEKNGLGETEDAAGGRLLVCTPTKVLFDGPRPGKFEGASPIQELEFIRLPGRPSGTSPLEMLNPIQRTYNRGVAQILEHRNLTTNPILVVDEQSGLEEEQITNKPGLIVKVTRRDGVNPLEYVQPPRLSEDVFNTQKMLADEMNFLGNIEGSEGAPPTRDASGELVKELRFNQDRFIGPTMRRAVHTMRRLVGDWMVYLPLIWDEEKIVSYAGDDQVIRTATVAPEMWDAGSVNVHVDIESMLPEGRGERQAKVFRLYEQGLLGLPGSPEAQKKFFDLARFPHMGRAYQPGGIHKVTAEQENGRMVQGTPAEEVPVLPWYDHQIHLMVHEEFMSSPEYLRLDPTAHLAFMQHRGVHLQVLQEMMMQQMAAAAAMAPAEEGGEGEEQQPAEGGGPSDGGRSGRPDTGGPVGAGANPNGAFPQAELQTARGSRMNGFPGV